MKIVSGIRGLLWSVKDLISVDMITVHPQRQRAALEKEGCLYKTGDCGWQYLSGEELLVEMQTSEAEFKRMQLATSFPQCQLFELAAFKRLKLDHPWIRRLSDHFSLRSALVKTIPVPAAQAIVLTFYSRGESVALPEQEGAGAAWERSIFEVVSEQMAAEGRRIDGVRRDNDRQPKQMVQDHDPFGEIVGTSRPMRELQAQLRILAPSDASVLITGESGTGKERIARAIHSLSSRWSKPMVTVNCAALPATLIESELFGYEKGAYTGAIERRIGKFEQARGGTIFLDEIGEMPPELQVKLLRVLQEREIERLGGNRTIPVDVRVVAATNRVIGAEVEAGNFRKDLYYRLNTFPIQLPALRERKEDIPLLASHFLHRFGKTLDRGEQALSVEALGQLLAYDWPGNIRELEHLIERTVLLNSGATILWVEIPARTPETAERKPARSLWLTLEEIEREYILEVLQKCKGKISGQNNAAEILGLPISTLYSRMLKLGIKKKEGKHAERSCWSFVAGAEYRGLFADA